MDELGRHMPLGAGWSRSGLSVAAQPCSRRLLLSGSAEQVSAALGADAPRAPNTTARVPRIGRCLWLRPDQWLLLCPETSRFKPPAAGGAWVLDVSSRYAGVLIHGARAAELLAAGCGLDFRERSFAIGSCAQSRIDLVPAILLRNARDEFEVMVERPLAHYFRLWLQATALCHSERSEESHHGGWDSSLRSERQS